MKAFNANKKHIIRCPMKVISSSGEHDLEKMLLLVCYFLPMQIVNGKQRQVMFVQLLLIGHAVEYANP